MTHIVGLGYTRKEKDMMISEKHIETERLYIAAMA